MADSYISTGITVSFGSLTAKLLDVNTSGETADQVEVTHQTSADEYKEFLSGLKDGGDITLVLHIGGTIPAVGTQDSLVITFPTGAGTFTATANLQKVKEISASLGERIIENVGFKITGKPVWS
jgi:hypothetical protein